jgi:hypothetical protein
LGGIFLFQKYCGKPKKKNVFLHFAMSAGQKQKLFYLFDYLEKLCRPAQETALKLGFALAETTHGTFHFSKI